MFPLESQISPPKPLRLGNNVYQPIYLLRDLFTTDRAAGAINGTAAEPGPGTRIVEDTENKLSISGGNLVLTPKAEPSWNDPYLIYPSLARVCGRAVFSMPIVSVGGSFSGGYWGSAFYLSSDGLVYWGGSTSVGPYSSGISYQFAMIARTTGDIFLIKGGIYTDWKILYVNSVGLAPIQVLGGACLSPSQNAYVFVVDLPAPWNDDYGIATQRLAGARAAGDTFTHEANCIIEFEVTSKMAGNPWLSFRKQDDQNQWTVESNVNGDLVLYEQVLGAWTSRGQANGVLASGHRVVIIADGPVIKVYSNNTLRITYSSATNFQTATNGRLASLGTFVISDIVTWPRTISGAALSTLEAV